MIYMEDVGRHNAVDKIAGYMFMKGLSPAGKIFYTTGRLTSEMVIKTVQMQIPILISRSGFTAWGVDLARQAGLTLIGRARGHRFLALAGEERIEFDADPSSIRGEAKQHRRKGAEPGRRDMKQVKVAPPRVVGVLLAGGQARRMGGGDKCLRHLANKPILAHVIDRVRHQVAALVLNANGDPGRFADFGLPVAADVIEGFAGPLAGVLTGMEWAKIHHPDCPWIVTIATDTPFLPRDLVTRMLDAADQENADLACARSGGRSHPVFGLWPVDQAKALRCAMIDEDIRKVDVFTGRYRLANVDFPTEPLDPFFNTNRPDDLIEAERILGRSDLANGTGNPHFND